MKRRAAPPRHDDMALSSRFARIAPEADALDINQRNDKTGPVTLDHGTGRGGTCAALRSGSRARQPPAPAGLPSHHLISIHLYGCRNRCIAVLSFNRGWRHILLEPFHPAFLTMRGPQSALGLRPPCIQGLASERQVRRQPRGEEDANANTEVR